MDLSRYDLIPDHMMANIKGYVEGKEYLGGFLTAVFAHDLFEAVKKADNINLPIIPIYVSYIYNKLPLICHGSYEDITNWYERKMNKGESNE